MTTPRPIAIVGPTAVGKSTVADLIAHKLHGEIISADSMQVYRGMDIGTAKTPAAQRLVPHHCIDLVDPGEAYSAALFQRHARTAVADISSRGLRAIVAGGTGLYVRAALDEFEFPAGDLSSENRLALELRAAEKGPLALHAQLAEADPAAAARIHPHNVRRTIRALEMLAEGKSYGDQSADFAQRKSHYPGTTFFGLTMDRPALYSRIDSRVEAMLDEGLLDEVAGLLAAGYRDALTAMQAIGYKELVPVVEGVTPLAEAVESVKRSSRRYAKRQLTWFRADPRIAWLDVTDLSPETASAAVIDLLESSGDTDREGATCNSTSPR
ncbi:MAG: tRNA (adenosine(37)-N6)-dimethylallyltransferase MiaA [Coriobacteriia bacterium]|nr:tRNA (adenosine(37)-N6)-dimethylallyltransferase MiaA [Coriobacteriia bacterium]